MIVEIRFREMKKHFNFRCLLVFILVPASLSVSPKTVVLRARVQTVGAVAFHFQELLP